MTQSNSNPKIEQIEMLTLTWASTQVGIPTEDELREAIEKMSQLFATELIDAEIQDVFDSVSKRLSVRMDMGTLIQAEHHKTWLQERHQQIEWGHWKAYYQFLVNSGRSPLVLDAMSTITDLILDHLGDPADPSPWARRGLVIGEVQSGKTGNYIGLLNKATDAGYRIFIVLTGNTESLRRQTQERIDEGILGRDSAAAVLGSRQGVSSGHGNRIGVGLHLPNISSLASTTTVLADFNVGAAKAQNIVPGGNVTIFFVTKKNKRVLDRIIGWLRSHAGPEGQMDLPLLFIDDEADYASVNTNKEEDDPTAINQAIRDILAISRRNSYVGFTATPFANIFINDEDDQDLFPRDFIYALDSPSNYRGAAEMFGAEDLDFEFDDMDTIRIVEDAEDQIPLGHKSSFRPSALPPSMREALRTFLVANMIRDLRGELKEPRSMLVNVSRFNSVQSEIATLLTNELASYRNAITLHSATYARGVPNVQIGELQRTFEQEYSDFGYSWSDVLGTMLSSTATIAIKVVNSRRDKELEEREMREGRNARSIAVGGDLLSRGLTLDDLIVSYFYRRTAASDTLLQMGRWFGYHDEYGDLARIWLSAETAANYAFTADSLEELRLELDRMKDQGLTPQQYGLAVRSHPGTLLITARNKMRAAAAGKKSISLRGRAIESSAISAENGRILANVSAAGEFIKALIDTVGQPTPPRNGSRSLHWSNTPKRLVADFLGAFDASATPLFSSDGLEKFVRHAAAQDLQEWDVILMSGQGSSTFAVDGVEVPRPTRTVSQSGNLLYISGARRRVAGPGDVGLPLTKDRVDEIEAEYLRTQAAKGTVKKRLPDTQIVPKLIRPLLLLYPIEGNIKDEVDGTFQKLDSTLTSVVIAIPGTPTENADDNVTYYLNAVAQRFWFEDFTSDEYDDDDY